MSEPAEVVQVADVVTDDQLLKVAFATSDGELVNQHFGSAVGFHVYGIDGDTGRRIRRATGPWPGVRTADPR